MDKLDLLKSNLKTLKALIEKTDDETELKTLNAQYDETIKEIGREEGRIEAATEIAALKEKNLAATNKTAVVTADEEKPSGVKVIGGKTNLYKAAGGGEYDLAAQMRLAPMFAHKHGRFIENRFKENPDVSMGVVKLMLDMYDKALNMSPLRVARIKADMQEGTDSEGGYLVPTIQRFELLAYARENSVALSRGTHIPMTSSSMTIPRELTKVSVAIDAEEGAVDESNPTFDNVTLTAKRYNAYSTSSNELIQDAANQGGVAGMLLDQFIEALGQKIDSAVFIGTGDPMSGIFIGGAGFSAVFGTGSTAFSELIETDLREAVRDVPKKDRNGAIWMMNDEILWDYVRGLKTTTGEYLFAETRMGGPAPDSIWGYDVVHVEVAPGTSDSAANTGFIAFGNPKGIYIGDRLTNMELLVDPYSDLANYQTRFFFVTRWATVLGLPKVFSRIVTHS